MKDVDVKKILETRKAFSGLHDLSYFNDDPVFLVDAGGVIRKIRAPSQVVLEHALYRGGLDSFTVYRLPASDG